MDLNPSLLSGGTQAPFELLTRTNRCIQALRDQKTPLDQRRRHFAFFAKVVQLGDDDQQKFVQVAIKLFGVDEEEYEHWAVNYLVLPAQKRQELESEAPGIPPSYIYVALAEAA